ncbi:MAG: phosphoesterase [Frankiales bacterium]|nr:phosphoesterase [Frankiales bacterium]
MRRFLAILGLLVFVAGCGSSSSSRFTAGSPTAAPSSRAPTAATAARVTKVLTVVEENHGVRATRAGMPYLSSLADRYGVATAYRSMTHPSLPNYLAMAFGSTFSISDDAGPARHPIRGPSVFDIALRHGHTAGVHAQSMPRACATANSGRYLVRHNPWTYATDLAACRQHDVPASRLAADISAGRLPNVGMLVPDACDDAHDCSLSQADAYLRDVMHAVFAGPDWRAGRLAVVVTFDEDESHGSGLVLTAVIAPSLHAAKVSAALSHLAWCRWMTDLVRGPALREAARAPSLGKAFGLG